MVESHEACERTEKSRAKALIKLVVFCCLTVQMFMFCFLVPIIIVREKNREREREQEHKFPLLR